MLRPYQAGIWAALASCFVVLTLQTTRFSALMLELLESLFDAVENVTAA
jgi:hypothetical protein